MSAAHAGAVPIAHYGHGLLAYVWHYLLARLLYDDLVRPLQRGAGAALLGTLAGAGIALWLWRRRSRHARGAGR